MKKGIVILITFIISIIIPINCTYCEDTEETIKSQQNEFKINDFLRSAEEYGGSFLEGMDVNELLDNAIKGEIDNSNIASRIWNLFRFRIFGKFKNYRKCISDNYY